MMMLWHIEVPNNNKIKFSWSLTVFYLIMIGIKNNLNVKSDFVILSFDVLF